jgi:PBP1b-binding outer membrane lipoprotein LpoB
MKRIIFIAVLIGMMSMVGCSGCATVEPKQRINSRNVRFKVKQVVSGTTHITMLDSAYAEGEVVVINNERVVVVGRVR